MKMDRCMRLKIAFPHAEWRDSLIWCPSQCDYRFEFDGKWYEIYLRWRHDDPWTAKLIPLIGENDEGLGSEWITLPIKWWGEDDDLDLIKKDAIEQTKIYMCEHPDF